MGRAAGVEVAEVAVGVRELKVVSEGGFSGRLMDTGVSVSTTMAPGPIEGA
jgi:hypothetical protein